jgi:endonuclease/exonuclease/phosphatase family metal-dependent hydrolase
MSDWFIFCNKNKKPKNPSTEKILWVGGKSVNHFDCDAKGGFGRIEGQKKRSHMKLLFFVLAICGSCFAAIENSVIPFVEQMEQKENISPRKYAPGQYTEIMGVLDEGGHRIRLASYNVLYNRDNNQEDKTHLWPERRGKVVELLQEMEPDVFGIQEDFQGHIDDILAQMGDVYDVYYEPVQDRECNAIFYRKDRFRLVKSKTWQLPAPSHAIMCRTLVMAQLEDQTNGKSLAFFNTHLAFSRVDMRESQARNIGVIVARYAAKMPVLLLGDMNLFPNHPDQPALPALDGVYTKRLMMEKAGLKDSMTAALLGHVGPLSTFTNEPPSIEPFRGVGTPGVFLDNILVTEDVEVLIHATQAATVDGQFPSDHMPIFIDFLLQ